MYIDIKCNISAKVTEDVCDYDGKIILSEEMTNEIMQKATDYDEEIENLMIAVFEVMKRADDFRCQVWCYVDAWKRVNNSDPEEVSAYERERLYEEYLKLKALLK